MAEDSTTTPSEPDVIELALLELGMFQVPQELPETWLHAWQDRSVA